MTPLVSVIIPCYNAGPWLEAALQSAVSQSWANIQVIVVDDGSTDDSLAVARRFESRGARVVTQPNSGASAARNHGLQLAKGEFIQFLDADDVLSTDKIAAQMGILLSGPPKAVATCRWGRFFEDPAKADFRDIAVFRDFKPAREFLIHQANTSHMIHPAAWLTPRALLEEAGPWDEALSLNDDGEYFCRVLVRASEVLYSPLGTTYYRSAILGSLSRRRSRSALVSLERSIALYSDHLLAAEDSPRVRSALANLWRSVQFDLYPDAPDLSRAAGRRSRELGTATVPPPFGPRLRLLTRIFGWKAARRFQRLFSQS